MSSEELHDLINKSAVDSDLVNCYSEHTLLKVAKKLSPDIIIIDLNLVSDKLSELFTSLRENAGGAYVLTLVSTDYYDKLHQVIDIGGVDDYLVKPINKGDFLARVQIAMKRKKFEYSDRPEPVPEQKKEEPKPVISEFDLYGNVSPEEEAITPVVEAAEGNLDDFDLFAIDESSDSISLEKQEISTERKEQKPVKSPYDDSTIEPVALDIEKDILPSSPYSDITGPGRSTGPGTGPGRGVSGKNANITLEPLGEFSDEVSFDDSFQLEPEKEKIDTSLSRGNEDISLGFDEEDLRLSFPDSETGPHASGLTEPSQQPLPKDESWGLAQNDLFSSEPDLPSAKNRTADNEFFTPRAPEASQGAADDKLPQDSYFDDLLDGGFNQFDDKQTGPAMPREGLKEPVSRPDSSAEIQFDKIESPEEVSKYFPGVGETKPPQAEARGRQKTAHKEDLLDDFVREEDLSCIDPRGGKAKGTGLPKVVSIIGNVFFIFALLMIAALSFFLIQNRLTGDVPQIGDHQIRTMATDDMKPAFGSGSMLMVSEVNPLFLRERDIITYRDPNTIDSIVTSRIVEIRQDGRGIHFMTLGDAAAEAERFELQTVYPENIVGYVTRYAPYIGFLFDFVLTREGTILLIFVPCVLIIAFELFKIFRHISSSGKKKGAKKSAQYGRYAEDFDE